MGLDDANILLLKNKDIAKEYRDSPLDVNPKQKQ